MMDNVVSLGGKNYLFRLSVKSLHLIEQVLGTSLAELGQNMSFGHCVTVARYALRDISTDKMLTDDEFDRLIDHIEAAELLGMFNKTSETDSGKN